MTQTLFQHLSRCQRGMMRVAPVRGGVELTLSVPRGEVPQAE
jgi:hypothetical protein